VARDADPSLQLDRDLTGPLRNCHRTRLTEAALSLLLAIALPLACSDDTPLDLRESDEGIKPRKRTPEELERHRQKGIEAEAAEHRKPTGTNSPHGPADAPNHFESIALGFEVSKPEDWVFLPRSSQLRDTTERVMNYERMPELMGSHVTVPLVSVAPLLDAKPGVDPVVEIYSKLVDTAQNPIALVFFFRALPENVIKSQIGMREQRDGYELIEPVTKREVGGVPAATARMRYRAPEASDGDPLIEERMWFIRQGLIFWWIHQTGPAPLAPESDAAFQAIVDSIVFADPIEPAVPPDLPGAIGVPVIQPAEEEAEAE
jgi:hypothetical protein